MSSASSLSASSSFVRFAQQRETPLDDEFLAARAFSQRRCEIQAVFHLVFPVFKVVVFRQIGGSRHIVRAARHVLPVSQRSNDLPGALRVL